MDLTFQVPVQYWSLHHRILLLSPITSTTGYCFCFGSIPSFFLVLSVPARSRLRLVCQAATAQERPRGATPLQVRGSDPEEPPRARGQGRRLGGATRGVVAAQAQEGLEELSHVEGQERWW